VDLLQTGLAAGPASPPRSLGRQLHRLGVAVAGTLTVLVGLVLVPLPGPGWAIVLVGTTVLGTEFAWAARLSGGARRRLGAAARWTRRGSWPVRAAVLAGLVVTAVGPVLALAL
jgi:uncharacterized protein (TIGR02611 family)